MDSEKVKAINGFVVVDILKIVPSKEGISLINPNTMQETASHARYIEHPWQGLVIKCSPTYFNGGIEYNSDIQEGDVVYLPGTIIEDRKPYMIRNGKAYPIIRYSDVFAYYRPTPEERSKFAFTENEVRVSEPVVTNTEVVADRKITEPLVKV